MLELDDETSDLLKEIVAITGESYEDAVSLALDERIKRVRIMQIGKTSPLRVTDSTPSGESSGELSGDDTLTQ
jgi:hypothetical protein